MGALEVADLEQQVRKQTLIKAGAQVILEELYRRLCNCRKNYPELEDLLNPQFHLDDCPYKQIVEKEDIEWEQTENS